MPVIITVAVVVGAGLVALAAYLVVHAVDRQARDQAWERIATSRRINAETRRDLEELAAALDAREDEILRREHQLDRLERTRSA